VTRLAAAVVGLAGLALVAAREPSCRGDLETRLVRARCELDVFVPTGSHDKAGATLLVPLCAPPQVPLRVALRTEPADALQSWKFDDEGAVVVEFGTQSGEKHVTLVCDCDLLVQKGVGCDDAAGMGSIRVRAAPPDLQPFVRAMAGADPKDPDVAKAAKTLAGKSTDLLALARAIDELAAKRIADSNSGSNDAAEALRAGKGTGLARARLAVALGVSFGVPSRIVATVPSRGEGSELAYLAEFHAGETGWLRCDLTRRRADVFPWPESEDVAVMRIDAETPITKNARPRPFSCRGGLTAGPKNGVVLWSCRDLTTTTCTRATAKQALPLLAAAFDELRRTPLTAGAVVDVASAPRVQKERSVSAWLAPFVAAIAGAK
jgi:hypothetical protein